MKIYILRKSQFLPIQIDEAWDFFSSPGNLKKITPPHMGFDIISKLNGDEMFPGMTISYKVKPILGLPLIWKSEIKKIRVPYYFEDEQKQGPYKFWLHKHFFEEVPGGIMVKDEVNYALPLGILGRFAHRLFVKSQLDHIFDYRKEALSKIFTEKNQNGLKKAV